MRKVLWAATVLGLIMGWNGAADAGPASCGNGQVSAKELCDGANLRGQTCESLGFNGGTLACSPTCQAFDTSGCTTAATYPASGQTTAYPADKNDGIVGPVPVPDDGTVQAGAPLSYTDNGDGTITDNNTGLMWEKKSFDAGLHNWITGYRWSGDGSQETIWDWIEDVNAEGGTGFAGYNDWRIPNVRELQSIVDYGRISPSIDPLFGPTAPSAYWTSTTDASAPAFFAWVVNFDASGSFPFPPKGVSVIDKSEFPWGVRAVRGGLD